MEKRSLFHNSRGRVETASAGASAGDKVDWPLFNGKRRWEPAASVDTSSDLRAHQPIEVLGVENVIV
jgi:hypothetical protein